MSSIPVFRQPDRPDGGFTLIETIVVVAILGLALALLASFGPPASGGISLRAAATELASGLREARSQAIVRNRPVEMTIDLGNRRWQVDGQSAKSMPDNLRLSLLTVAGERRGEAVGAIRFLPDGSSTGGRIDIEGAGRRLSIAIDWLSGRVTIGEERGG